MLDAHKQHTRVQLRQLSATHHRPLQLLEYNYIGSPSAAPALPQLCHAPRLLISRSHGFYINYVVHCDYSSPDRIGNTSTLPSATTTPHLVARSTSPTPRVRVPQHVARLVKQLVAPLVVDNSALRRLVVDYSASRRLVVDYFTHAARSGASACRAARHTAHRAARRRQLRLTQARRRLLRLAQARRAAHRRLLRLAQARRRPLHPHRKSGCLGMSRGSSRDLSCRSSSTTSPPPHVRVPRHVARLVTRLAAPLVLDYSASRRLVVDNSASRRLVVDYFASAARPGASTRRVARHVAHLAARRRLLRLAQACRAARHRLLCQCFRLATY
jgi:hypothetical protein